MSYRFKDELCGFFGNAWQGIRALFFWPIQRPKMRVSFDQAAVWIAVLTGVSLWGSWHLSLPDPEFTPYGASGIAIQVVFSVLACHMVALIIGRRQLRLPLLIALLSVWPWFYLVWLFAGDYPGFSFWQFEGPKKYLYLGYNLWIIGVLVRATTSLRKLHVKAIVLTMVTLAVFLLAPLHYFGGGDFWYPAYDEVEEKSDTPSRKINIEDTYYHQFAILKEIKEKMLPGRKAITDIYFVGFGGDASQDVFRREIQYARKLFDKRFDTKGRSVALINSFATLRELPLASRSNLEIVLLHMGGLMDPEDVLFLYLTSHGSEDAQLSVSFRPLALNDIQPPDLKTMLDRAGIQYRVLVVSACYSGSFVKDLQNDKTLVLTAAAADKTSFGCSNTSKFTYLGRAIFKDQLRHNPDIIDAFEKAIQAVGRKEKWRGLEPSDPQLVIGDQIRPKLGELAQRIRQWQTQNLDGPSPNDLEYYIIELGNLLSDQEEP